MNVIERALITIAVCAIILFLESRGVEAYIERRTLKHGWSTRMPGRPVRTKLVVTTAEYWQAMKAAREGTRGGS